MSKIKLTDTAINRLAFLCDSGDLPRMVKAIEAGQTIVIVGNNQEEKEWFLAQYLEHLGAYYTYVKDGCIIKFDTGKHGRGGERPKEGIV